MTVEVLGRVATCSSCQTLFSYSWYDLTDSGAVWVRCPTCKAKHYPPGINLTEFSKNMERPMTDTTFARAGITTVQPSGFWIDFKEGSEEQYLAMLNAIKHVGVFKGDRTGTGTQDLFGYQLRMDLSKGFPLLTTKKMFFRGIFEELLWMMSGDTNNKTLQDKNVKIWDEWATKEQCARFGRKEGDLGPVYGHQWRSYGADSKAMDDGKMRIRLDSVGLDQLQNALDMLRNNPWSRRIIVSGWNPREATQVALPPCHTLFQFSVRPDEDDIKKPKYLDCQLYQRSSDVFLGVPFNIASYALLTSIMAGLAGLEPGNFVHTFGSVHIYNNHREQVDEQLSRDPYALPTLRIRTFTPHLDVVIPEGQTLQPEDIHWTTGDPTTWSIDDFLKYCSGAEDFEIQNYQHHPKIKAEVSV